MKLLSTLVVFICLNMTVKCSGLVWESLPEGFDMNKPDEILDTVRAKHRNDPKFPFTHIYVFGDSSSDTGNYVRIHSSDVPTLKFYWRNRFSNGPIWVDYLQAINNVRVKTFAHGGAPISNLNHIIEPGIPDFFGQIKLYKTDQYDPKPKRPLAMLGFAGNDMLTDEVTSTRVAVDYHRAIVKLLEVGEIKDIVILGTPALPFKHRGFDAAIIKAVDRISAEYDDVNIAYISAFEQQTLMLVVPPPTSDALNWKGFTSCFNQTTFTLCDEPQHRFLHDNYHFSTVPYYNIANRITRFINQLWVK